MMDKSGKAKRFVWILSLALGPVVFCVLLLVPPGMADIEAIKKSIVELVFTFVSCWAGCFVLVWIFYWFSKFVIKYAPFIW